MKTEFKRTEIVKFNQNEMVCPISNNEPFVLVKSIIEGVGLNYDTAIGNLKNNDRLKSYLAEWQVSSSNLDELTCQNLNLTKFTSYTVLPIRKVAAWLYGIQVNSVKEPARSVLVKFQEKCDDVLYNYFFGRREIEQSYLEEKRVLLNQKKEYDKLIKDVRKRINETPDGKDLIKYEMEVTKIKFQLQRLEQKQFGMVYTLFDDIPESEVYESN